MSKDFTFMIGDIIQLKKANDNSNPFKTENVKLYKIADITGDSVKLGWQVQPVRLTDIKPILINSIEDAHICLHKKGNKYSFVVPGMSEGSVTNEYYMDSIEKMGWEDLVNRIKNNEFTFVNQIQRYIKTYFNEYYLEVNL